MPAWAENPNVDSRDEKGRYCGLNESTGEMEPTPEGFIGYCGPNCECCKGFEVYALQNGIWCCAADYEYEEH